MMLSQETDCIFPATFCILFKVFTLNSVRNGYSVRNGTTHITLNAGGPLRLCWPGIAWAFESLCCRHPGHMLAAPYCSSCLLSSCCSPPVLSTLKSHNYLLPAFLDAQTIHCSFSAPSCTCSCLLLVTAHSPLLQDRSQSSCWGNTNPTWCDWPLTSSPHVLLLSPSLTAL